MSDIGGYLTFLKTMNVTALQEAFDEQYPVEQWRGVHVSVEYPVEKANYPGIWVNYSDVDKLQIAGVDHVESEVDGQIATKYTRWKFGGYVSYTVTALTSRERDRLYDELVKVLAFGRFDSKRKRFREHVESNPFIAANMDFDEIEPQGDSAAPGTPWGTDEIIYERTLNMEIIGEFVSDNSTGELALLTDIVVIPEILLPGEEGEYGLPEDEALTNWH